MAQSGSASALGAEGRGFKSLCPDQSNQGPLPGPEGHGPLTAHGQLARQHGTQLLEVVNALRAVSSASSMLRQRALSVWRAAPVTAARQRVRKGASDMSPAAETVAR